MVPKTGCAPSSQRQGHITDMRVGEQFLEEHINTDRDSILLLRQIVTTALTITARSFLEHVKGLKGCSQARVASQCSSTFLLLQLCSLCGGSPAFWDHALSCWAATQLLLAVVCLLCWSSPGCFQDHCSTSMKRFTALLQELLPVRAFSLCLLGLGSRPKVGSDVGHG